jgi:hypothetical protein
MDKVPFPEIANRLFTLLTPFNREDRFYPQPSMYQMWNGIHSIRFGRR